MKFLFSTLIILLVAGKGIAQQDTTDNSQKEIRSNAVVLNKSDTKDKPHGYVYNKEFSMGGILNTSGWGFFGDFTKRINTEKKRVYFFEINFLKSPKELKKVNEYSFSVNFDSPRPFVYGKQNSFFAVKAGYGNKFMIGQKAEKSGFEVDFNYAIGPSLGFIKPYYLEVLYENDGIVYEVSQKYSAETESVFLDATSIYGYSGFNKGFGEVSLVPGAFAKAGMHFDWASYDDFVKAFEAGIGAEVYSKNIPIMIVENNKPYFVYLYLSLQLGKKW